MPESLKKILENLPPNLKKAFYAERTFSLIKDAVTFSQLKPEPELLNKVEKVVIDIILGREPLDSFRENLKTALNVPEINLNIIDEIIQKNLFLPLKNDLVLLEINKPKFGFSSLKIKEPLPQKEPLQKDIQKSQITKTKLLKFSSSSQGYNTNETLKSKENIPSQTEVGNEKIKTTKEKEIKKIELAEKTEPAQSFSFPDASEIKVENPLDRVSNLKKVDVPKIPIEEQQKIHSKLLEAMGKGKKTEPQIIEEMKKVEKTPLPSKKSQSREKKEKAVKETEEISEVITGKNNTFLKETKTMPKAKTSSILDIKIKETEQKEEEIPETIQKPIEYKKPEKPFGET